MDQRIIIAVIVIVVMAIIVLVVGGGMSSENTEGMIPHRGRRVFVGRRPIRGIPVVRRGIVGGPIIQTPIILDCPLGYQLSDDGMYCIPLRY